MTLDFVSLLWAKELFKRASLRRYGAGKLTARAKTLDEIKRQR
jgi:hypothetical protein